MNRNHGHVLVSGVKRGIVKLRRDFIVSSEVLKISPNNIRSLSMQQKTRIRKKLYSIDFYYGK